MSDEPRSVKMRPSTLALILGPVVALPALGILGALGGYVLRHSLASSKTAGAKNIVGALVRSGVAAYERDHRFCGSAESVPRVIPMATTTYTPTANDWSGTADAGWTCLRFSLTDPIAYQYGYVRGSDTGKTGVSANGFEVTARGFIEGNGVTSLVARGADIKNGALEVTPLYVENEVE